MGGGVQGAMGGSREQWGGVLFYIGEIKNFAFFKRENFQKMLRNQWKIYNFVKIFKEISRLFEKFLKFYRNFSENLGKIEKIWICWGFRGGAPRS